MTFTPTIRRNWGTHDAQADRERGRLPMSLLQAYRAGQPTRDVDEIATRHPDRAYAKGYVMGWEAV